MRRKIEAQKVTQSRCVSTSLITPQGYIEPSAWHLVATRQILGEEAGGGNSRRKGKAEP